VPAEKFFGRAFIRGFKKESRIRALYEGMVKIVLVLPITFCICPFISKGARLGEVSNFIIQFDVFYKHTYLHIFQLIKKTLPSVCTLGLEPRDVILIYETLSAQLLHFPM
jgi:hypothetical protein